MEFLPQDVPCGNYKSFKVMAEPALKCVGIDIGFAEDTWLFLQCKATATLDITAEVQIDQFVPQIELLTDFETGEDLCAHCSGLIPPLTPVEFLKEKVQEKLHELSANMTQAKIFMCLAQFLLCWKASQTLDKNEHSIQLIKRNLDRFGRNRMRIITDFLRSPAAAHYFGRCPENEFPNPWGAPSIEFLDEANGELKEIIADIKVAEDAARATRWRMGLSAVFSIARIGHSWWTYRVAVPKDAVQETLFAVSVGLDTLQAGWSLDLACVAHLQVHDLRKLAAIAEHYADEIHDAQDVLKFPTRP